MLKLRLDVGSNISEVMRLFSSKCSKNTKSVERSPRLLVEISDFCSNLLMASGPLIAISRTFGEDEVKMVHTHSENVTAMAFFDENRVIIGFDTGQVRVYDASLSHILYEFKIKSTPVLRIKRVPRTILCKSSQHHQHEEIWYLHADRVVVAHTSKALDIETTSKKNRKNDDDDDVIEHNSWELHSDQIIHDFSVHIPKRSGLFEMNPPHHAVVIAAGSNPPLARYQGLKADSSNVGLTSLAKAVVGKLTSNLTKSASNWIPSWAPIKIPKKKREEVVIRQVRSQSKFQDPSREIEHVFVDPSNTLMATSDTLGRVLVMEMETMQIIRVFKGYRNAQCAWIRVDSSEDEEEEEGVEDTEEQTSSPKLRRRRSSAGSFTDSLDRCPYLGLYLVIYTSQRNVLEIWRMRNGPRVDAIALKSSTTCRLFTVNVPIFSSTHVQFRTRCMILRNEEQNDNVWKLEEVVLDRDAKIVVCRHYDSVIDQDQNLILCRLEAALKSETSSSSSILEQVRKLHNLSHLKRAALEIEKNTTIKDLYVKAMRDIIETLDHEDIIESTDETPKRVSRRRTRLRMQLRIRLKLYEAWKEWLVLRTVKKKEENWMKWAGDGDDDDDDDDGEKHKIPFTIFRRDMERLENAPNLVSRKEIEYARCASRTSTSFCRLLFTRIYNDTIWKKMNVEKDIFILAFASWFLRTKCCVVNTDTLTQLYSNVSDKSRLVNALKVLCNESKERFDRVLGLASVCRNVFDVTDEFDDICERAKVAIFINHFKSLKNEDLRVYGRNSRVLYSVVAELELASSSSTVPSITSMKNVEKLKVNLLETLQDKKLKPLEKFYQAFHLDEDVLAVERIAICMNQWKRNDNNCAVLKRVILNLEQMKSDSKRNEVASRLWTREFMPYLLNAETNSNHLKIVLRVSGRLFNIQGLSTSSLAVRLKVWEALLALNDMTTSPTYFFFDDGDDNDKRDLFDLNLTSSVSKTIQNRRLKLIGNLVRRCRDSKAVESVLGLASDLNVCEDFVRMESTMSMYRRGCDTEAEIQFELVTRTESLVNLCRRLVPLAQSRLRALFRVCVSSAKHSSILSAVDSVSCNKIMEDNRSASEDMKEVTTLTMTRSLLKRLESVLKDDKWVLEMSRAASDAWEAAHSRKLILDTSRRRPRTGTKMFGSTSSSSSKKKKKEKKVFPGRVPDLGFGDGGGDWV